MRVVTREFSFIIASPMHAVNTIEYYLPQYIKEKCIQREAGLLEDAWIRTYINHQAFPVGLAALTPDFICQLPLLTGVIRSFSGEKVYLFYCLVLNDSI